jgi:two-component system phosphate regulon sensor histidine kinase PhoR
MSLRWKITLSFILLVAATFGLLGAYLHVSVGLHTTEQVREGLLAEARLIAKTLPEPPWEPSRELQRVVKELDDAAGARVTLIAGDGTVVADSRHDPGTMDDHGSRPERVEAVAGGWGSATHYSKTLGVDMLYVAVAMPGEGDLGTARGKAVIRLAMPLTAVEMASARLRTVLGGAFLVAMIAAWLVSHKLAGSLTEPVQRLVRVARRVGAGDLEVRAEGIEGGELAMLAEVFNNTVERLADLVAASEKESRYYATILEQMTDAVVVVDEQRRVQFVNRIFGDMFGVEVERAAGQLPEAVSLNYQLSSLLARAVEQGTAQRDEIRLLHPEARTLIAVAAPLVGDEEAVMGAVGLLHDVTDMEKADQVRRDFVSNASHELRTPTAGIKALAEALQGGALEDAEKGPEFVDRIIETAERLGDILDDMLTLTRVERGQELLRPEWVEVSGAFDRALSQIGAAATADGVAVSSQFEDGDRVYADPDSLQTVLMNLLDNAVKYTAADGEVVVSGSKAPGGYEVAVSDTGIGIPAEDLDRIFERFYRVDKSRGRAAGGTGLGLAIVKHIAEAHGGEVAVDSAPGRGSTFRVFFPDGSRT